MATGMSAIKFVGSFIRGRLPLMYELSDVYKPVIHRRKEELIGLMREKVDTARKSELAKKLKDLKGFYTLELSPPDTMEMKKLTSDLKLAQDFFKTRAVFHLTVKQAWLLFLVGLEVVLWFFLGETIAKGRVVGYVIP